MQTNVPNSATCNKIKTSLQLESEGAERVPEVDSDDETGMLALAMVPRCLAFKTK